MDDHWFSVRSVYRSIDADGGTYEERVTLWRAPSAADALTRAEVEAREYAADVDCAFLGLLQLYELADQPGDGAEVFSLMRDSDLDATAYLDRHFDTGTERQQRL